MLLCWYSFDGKLGSHLDFFSQASHFYQPPSVTQEFKSHAIKKQRNGFPCPLFSSYDL